ncbi:MAG: DUF3016 domain-containing protein [Verrucomicrobia bacterium]|nr:DUF3016 domain-containing protein [Verrucomicrobiota bacterium]
MKSVPAFVVAALGLATSLSAGPAPASNPITVEFVRPDRFVDVQQSGTSREMSRDVLLPDLRRFVQQEAQRFLPPGTSLKIFITEIDDAGHISFNPRRELRVVSQAYPARVEFNWELRDARGQVTRGRERLVQRSGEAGERPEFLGAMPTVKFALQQWLRQNLR